MSKRLTIEECFVEYVRVEYRLWHMDMVLLYGSEKANKMTEKDFLKDKPPDKLLSKFKQYVSEIQEEQI